MHETIYIHTAWETGPDFYLAVAMVWFCHAQNHGMCWEFWFRPAINHIFCLDSRMTRIQPREIPAFNCLQSIIYSIWVPTSDSLQESQVTLLQKDSNPVGDKCVKITWSPISHCWIGFENLSFVIPACFANKNEREIYSRRQCP